jgi:hypothetical protein
MTAPHPRAVGSYGDEFAAFAEMRTGRPLRWWQRLVATRLLEYDAAGSLVWLVLLLTMARQVGKSWLLREFCVWRIHQADRYGEEQLVINTGKDISVCKEVQRPARAWAKERKALGYDVREANGQEEISTPDGSRWMLRARESVYGYSASAAAVDEAWAVSPGAVEDGLEPTMPERAQPQLLLVSTAHRKATPLMVMRRADALASLQTPTDVLLIEWSAPPGADVADRSAWRAASPYWSDRRERLIESSLRRALGGATDDPWEDDPLEAFRSQWLNVWPQHAVGASANDEALLDEGVWAGLIDRGVMPTGELVLALEDWYGTGAAAAAASRLDDGRVMVWGATFARRAGAVAWLTQLAELHPGSRLRVGASLERSEELVGIPVEGIEGCGLAQTRTSLSGLRELVADDRLIHDGGIDLDGQLRGLRVVRTTLGLSVSLRSGRHDLAKCAAWAAASAAQAAVTESAIF